MHVGNNTFCFLLNAAGVSSSRAESMTDRGIAYPWYRNQGRHPICIRASKTDRILLCDYSPGVHATLGSASASRRAILLCNVVTISQVQAWRADPSTADQARHVWSSLGSTNTIIAEMLNSLATAAAASTDGHNFEASAKVSRQSEKTRCSRFLAECGNVVGSSVFCRANIHGDGCAVTNVQVLSAIPSTEWAGENEGVVLIDNALGKLIKLKAAFAKARQLLREMGEVRA